MFNKKLLSSIDLGKYKKNNPYKKDIILDPMGQWKHPGKNTRIPSNHITMKGVNYPVLGVANTGQKQMMQPGREYNFPGADYVDEYPQMKKGGLPKAQKGAATFQDSLDLYNNALQQKAFYDSKKQFYDIKNYRWYDGTDMKKVEKETYDYEKNSPGIGSYWSPKQKSNFQKTKNLIKSNKDPNVSYLIDIITGALDPDAPALRYDNRIKPQGLIEYAPYKAKYSSKEADLFAKLVRKFTTTKINTYGVPGYEMLAPTKQAVIDYAKKNGYSQKDAETVLYKLKKENLASRNTPGVYTTLPYYDPLAVKPGRLLTDNEIKLRVQKYGTDGIPDDRLKKLNINTTPPKKTTPPKTTTKPCSNPITTVINNVPDKIPFGKKLIGTNEETLPVTGGKCEYVKTINPIYEDIKIDPIIIGPPPKLENSSNLALRPAPELEEHIDAPQYTLEPYTAERPYLDIRLPQNKIKRLFDSGILDRKGHIKLGKKDKTRLIPRIVQKVTGYDPEYFEGSYDEEDNYTPGELDYGNATGSQMEFRGAASLKDLMNQKKYIKDYEEYEKKLDEKFERAKKKQIEGQAFKKGGASSNAKYYQTGGLTRFINQAGKIVGLPPITNTIANTAPKILNSLKSIEPLYQNITLPQSTRNLLVDERLITGKENQFPLLTHMFPSENMNVSNFEYKPYSEGWTALTDMKNALEGEQWVPGKEDYYTLDEIYNLINKQKNYLNDLAKFNEMHPDELGEHGNLLRWMQNDFSRDELFSLLFPNSSLPNFKAKLYRPEHINLLKQTTPNPETGMNLFDNLIHNTNFGDKGFVDKRVLERLITEPNTEILPGSENLMSYRHIYKPNRNLNAGKLTERQSVIEFLKDHDGVLGFKFKNLDNEHPKNLNYWKNQVLDKFDDFEYKLFQKNFKEQFKPGFSPKLKGLDAYNQIINRTGSRNKYGGELHKGKYGYSVGNLIRKQDGGNSSEIDDPNKFYENWFQNRIMPSVEGQKLLDKIRPEALERSRASVPYVFSEDLDPNEAGYYDVDTRQIMLNKFLPEAQIEATKFHERMHDIQAGDKFTSVLEKPQGYLVEQNIIEPKAINTGNLEWDKNLKKNYEDIVDPNEIHARVMTLRRLAGFKPDQTITEKDLQDYFKAVKDSGESLDPDIEDLKAVTKGNQSIVNLLNDMVSVPGQTKDLGYAKDGGQNKTKLSEQEEKAFQKFYSTLPENLQSDDDTYDIRGYWDGLGRPSEFDYSQPKEKDGYYHAFSINPNTGEYLKSPAHDTFQLAVDEDRKIGYRPITNVYGRNVATENPSLIEEEQSFLRNTEGPSNYIETELTPEEIEEYKKGGYVVEDISVPKLQPGGLINTIKQITNAANNVDKIKIFSEIGKDVSAISKEILGEVLQGSSNRKAIASGNSWLNNWINNPVTQAKIQDDILNAPFNSNVSPKYLSVYSTPVYGVKAITDYDKYIFALDAAKKFKPEVKEYPISTQIIDFIEGEPHAHIDNLGFTSMHQDDPFERELFKSGYYKPNSTVIDTNFRPYRNYGSFISRDRAISPYMRESASIHEGTHDWITDWLLRKTGQFDLIQNELDPDYLNLYKRWKNKDNTLTKIEKNKGYLADPAEVHARIMQLRRHNNLTPFDIITNENSGYFMDQLLKNDVPFNGPRFAEMLGNDRNKLAKLMNDLYGIALPVGVAAGAGAMLANPYADESPVGKFQDGGAIKNLLKFLTEENAIIKPVSKLLKLPGSPNTGFISEIDWAKWNPETPMYPELINEYNTIEKLTKANGTWMKNPDGSIFNGTPEQFIQQQSSWFKKAFGDSKLVNPDGSPMIVYHGSAKKFDTFDPSKFQLGDSGYSGSGIYTVPSKVTADSYALSSAKFHSGDIEPTVYELYGQANNPITSEELIKMGKNSPAEKEMDLFNFHRKSAPLNEQLLNYDAAIHNQVRGIERIRPWNDAREIVFPTNKQLKSAVGNVGFFDMNNPNIYKGLIPLAIGTAVGGLMANPYTDKSPIGEYKTGGTLPKAQDGLRILEQLTNLRNANKLSKAEKLVQLKNLKPSINLLKQTLPAVTHTVPSLKINTEPILDWSLWNPETPKIPELMDEYKELENLTKKEGSWMLNPDSTPYAGTPFQFIQEMSTPFKKAYPEGFFEVFRGVQPRTAYRKGAGLKSYKFAADKDLATFGYGDNKILTPFDDDQVAGTYHLIHPKESGKNLILNTGNDFWTNIRVVPMSESEKIEKKKILLEKIPWLEEKIRNSLSQINNPNNNFNEDLMDLQMYRIDSLTKEKAAIQDYLDNFDTYHEQYENIPFDLKYKLPQYERLRTFPEEPFGTTTVQTDHLGQALGQTDYRSLLLENIDDGGFGNVTILNNRPGNFFKSRIGNVGWYDLQNSDIYKQYGGEYELGDEVDEATMKELKKLGFTFEKI